jgi:hypothetical protein
VKTDRRWGDGERGGDRPGEEVRRRDGDAESVSLRVTLPRFPDPLFVPVSPLKEPEVKSLFNSSSGNSKT